MKTLIIRKEFDSEVGFFKPGVGIPMICVDHQLKSYVYQICLSIFTRIDQMGTHCKKQSTCYSICIYIFGDF